MKAVLVGATVILLAALSYAAPTLSQMRTVSTQPTTCQGGSATQAADVWVLITGGVGSLYICTATNTPLLIGTVPGPISPNGVPQVYTSTPSGGVSGPALWGIPGVGVDSQTGTSYTIPITDDVHLVTGNNVAATAWTGFALANNYAFSCLNLGAGLITYTPASGVIFPGSVASQIIPQNWFCLNYIDNNNTFMPVMPTIKAFANTGTFQAEGINTATGQFSAVRTMPCLPGTPTISSGFGTGATISAGVNPCSFRVNVGTGGTATNGTIGLPTAVSGWNCKADDITTNSATVFSTRQVGNGTTAGATISNFNTSGAAAAWVASDILAVSCFDF